MKLERLDHQNKSELSMIEVAHEILRESNQVYEFNHLLEEGQEYMGLTTDELEQRMVLFYTQMNADGSFISLGENRWGLRAWYPVDSIDEEIISTIDDDDIKKKHKRSKNVLTALDEDVIDYSDDDPEDHEVDEDDYDYEDEDEDEEDESRELNDYRADLDELGDDDPEDELEDGLEGDLGIIDDDDLDADEDEDDDL